MRRDGIGPTGVGVMAGLMLLWLASAVLAAVAPATGGEPAGQACLECHGDPKRTSARDNRTVSPYVDIEVLFRSAHADLDCTGCHSDLEDLPHDDRPGAVDCGACHDTVAAQYRESIHGQAAKRGSADAPGCTDCHGAHAIAAPLDSESSVAPRNIPKTCAARHEEEGVVGRYNLPSGRYATYLDSFHGVVNRYGEAAVANCASCHGVHDIRPSSDPASRIHSANLPQTCGTCHPGAEKGLSGVKVHVRATPKSSRGMYYVRTFYTYFTGLLMVCFIAYMAIDIYGYRRRRQRV
ncbi:MAG: cytochrome c3 family protein [Candidatus Latescibacteria bacterium]|nr:cytochrome c3 family protein [Candidatus Latescibacterota bacterium]